MGSLPLTSPHDSPPKSFPTALGWAFHLQNVWGEFCGHHWVPKAQGRWDPRWEDAAGRPKGVLPSHQPHPPLPRTHTLTHTHTHTLTHTAQLFLDPLPWEPGHSPPPASTPPCRYDPSLSGQGWHSSNKPPGETLLPSLLSKFCWASRTLLKRAERHLSSETSRTCPGSPRLHLP